MKGRTPESFLVGCSGRLLCELARHQRCGAQKTCKLALQHFQSMPGAWTHAGGTGSGQRFCGPNLGVAGSHGRVGWPPLWREAAHMTHDGCILSNTLCHVVGNSSCCSTLTSLFDLGHVSPEQLGLKHLSWCKVAVGARKGISASCKLKVGAEGLFPPHEFSACLGLQGKLNDSTPKLEFLGWVIV